VAEFFVENQKHQRAAKSVCSDITNIVFTPNYKNFSLE